MLENVIQLVQDEYIFHQCNIVLLVTSPNIELTISLFCTVRLRCIMSTAVVVLRNRFFSFFFFSDLSSKTINNDKRELVGSHDATQLWQTFYQMEFQNQN